MKAALFVLGFSVLAACSASPQLPPDPVIPPPFAEQDDSQYRPPDTDEAATQAFLEQEIERRGRAPEPPPAPPPGQVRTQPQTVYLDNYSRPYQQPESDPSVDAFPWATAYGASVGALIGASNHEAGEGAAIGAGIGFLLDLGRWGF